MDALFLIYMVLYLVAGVFFGLAAGNVKTRRGWSALNFLAMGALCWVLVEFLQLLQPKF